MYKCNRRSIGTARVLLGILALSFSALSNAASIWSTTTNSPDGNYTVGFSNCTDPYIQVYFCWLEESADAGVTWSGMSNSYDYYSGSGFQEFVAKPSGTYRYRAVEYDYWSGYYSNISDEIVVTVGGGSPPPPAWSLTNDQRRAYLYYYAPIIFKRANENDGRLGYDWITNFDFDRTPTFNDNKRNWKQIGNYINTNNPPYSSWAIRPTLYTAAIEFMDGGMKQLTLIYHIYHAIDQRAIDYKWGIHDWERVEVRIKGVVGSPGSGEYVDHAVITQHHRSLVRTSAEAQFVQTTTGKHLMVFQAEWSGRTNIFGEPHGQELRFVQDSWAYTSSRLSGNYQAEVDVNGESSRKNVHYVFVPVESPAAVTTFAAQAITPANKHLMASGRDNGDTVQWSQAKRVVYELQDLADIYSTHSPSSHHTNPYDPNRSWLDDDKKNIVMTDPILSETGATELAAGTYSLFTGSADIEESGLNDEREGYPSKSFWFGCHNLFYSYDKNQLDNFLVKIGLMDQTNNVCDKSLNGTHYDSRGNNRLSANGQQWSAGSYWYQHDYFSHFGSTDDSGIWLLGDWYSPARGGFDGRYVQLFDDLPGQISVGPAAPPPPPVTPLQVYFEVPYDYCGYNYYPTNMYAVLLMVNVVGGTPPYVITWDDGYNNWQSSGPEYLSYYTSGSVTVTSADGQSQFVPFYLEPTCYTGPY
jgi:hypothetical protein